MARARCFLSMWAMASWSSFGVRFRVRAMLQNSRFLSSAVIKATVLLCLSSGIAHSTADTIWDALCGASAFCSIVMASPGGRG